MNSVAVLTAGAVYAGFAVAVLGLSRWPIPLLAIGYLTLICLRFALY